MEDSKKHALPRLVDATDLQGRSNFLMGWTLLQRRQATNPNVPVGAIAEASDSNGISVVQKEQGGESISHRSWSLTDTGKLD